MSSQRVDLLNLKVTQIKLEVDSQYAVSVDVAQSNARHRVLWSDEINHYTCTLICRETKRGSEKQMVYDLWQSLYGQLDSFWIYDPILKKEWVNVMFDQDTLTFKRTTLPGWYECQLKFVTVVS